MLIILLLFLFLSNDALFWLPFLVMEIPFGGDKPRIELRILSSKQSRRRSHCWVK